MATLYPPHVAANWSANVWSTADDNAQDTAPPGATDDIAFTANSGAITLDVNGTCAGGTFAGGSLDLNGNQLNCGANALTQTGGSITASGGDEIIATTFTASDLDYSGASGDLTITGNLTVTGAWAGHASHELVVTGDLKYTGATSASNIYVKMTGTANIYGQRLNNVPSLITVATGADTTTQGAYANAKGLVVETGGTLGGSAYFLFYFPNNDFCDVQGTCSCQLRFRSSGRTNSGKIVTTDLFNMQCSNGVVTQSGDIDVNSLIIGGNGANQYGGLTYTGTNADLGDITLGNAGDLSQTGRLDLNCTTVSMASVTATAETHLTNTHQLNFRSCSLTLSGTLDGSNIDTAGVSNTAATVTGGTISNLDCSSTNELDATGGATDGGGNLNIDFGVTPTPTPGTTTIVTVATSSIINRVGSANIGGVRNNSYDYMINVVLSGTINFTASTEKLNLYGYPLSLMARGDRFVLCVISRGNTNVSSDTYVYNGVRYLLFESGNNNIYAINNVTGSIGGSGYTLWHGLPIALNADNSMVMADLGDIATDETAELMLGGVPILVGRIGENWHLIVGKNNS